MVRGLRALNAELCNNTPKVPFEAEGLKWFDPCQPPFRLYGVFHDGYGYTRMDSETGKSVNENVSQLYRNTSGGRLSFETDSPYIAIFAVCDDAKPATMPLTGYTGFDLYLEKENGLEFTNVFVPPVSMEAGYSGIHYFRESGSHRVLIHFPLYNNVHRLLIGLRDGFGILPYCPYRSDFPVVIYGSSITQGACASRPGNSFAAIFSRLTRRDIQCFGFSSGAHGEIQMAEYLASLPMSLFVLDYDHNDCDKPELLEARHEAFYKVIRDRNPDLPIVIMTAPGAARTFYRSCPAKTKKILRRTYINASKRGEPVAFLDCGRIFGQDLDAALTDRIHPNDYGHVLIAKSLIRCVRKLEKDLEHKEGSL